MKRPKISIIIPVFNTETYLPVCLESILKLNEQDYEVLLVDDGSTDGSGDICDAYACRDDRFTVIHQENKGVSSARNIALERAMGEWICMIDSDDEISSDYFDSTELELKYDVIVKPSVTFSPEGDIVSRSRIGTKQEICGKKSVLSYSIMGMTNPLWDKIFKKELIGNYRLNEKFRIEEDYLFGLSVMQNCSSVLLSPFGQYIQHRRSDSAMGKIIEDTEAFLDSKLKVIDELLRIYNQESNEEFLISLLFNRFFPFFAGKRYILQMSPKHIEKLRYLLSIYKFNKLKYLPLSRKISISLRVLCARFCLILIRL